MKSTDNHAINSALFLPKWRFVVLNVQISNLFLTDLERLVAITA
ncbi:hypothetical protein [Marinilongibacter aquaticus]|nr:hypothetical protein [Marinilongibacter aquaticus]